ncbi:Ms4533A family Cys-rich leader peptide [Streptomyces buecherae]|uniref:Ms4533A family Cys-rich leader peptide n=1 Tax=Streptomyces buecherae TaxID=2763006 RepID=UPI003653254A
MAILIVSLYETSLPGGEKSFSLLRMSRRPAIEIASFELALIGVTGHAVADIHCRQGQRHLTSA